MRTLNADHGTIRFFQHHRWLIRGPHTRAIARRALRFARAEIRWVTRELAETRRALRPHPPWTKSWLADATCIHSHEGAWTANTGNGYFGGGQFLESTWKSVNGPHHPAFDHPGDRRYPFTVSPREQLYRMWLVWRRDGGSWVEWGTRGMCGLA